MILYDIYCDIRSPDGHLDVFLDALSKVLTRLIRENSNVKVTGYFNVEF